MELIRDVPQAPDFGESSLSKPATFRLYSHLSVCTGKPTSVTVCIMTSVEID